ncbi:MAG: DUF4136 domain-containing protein [Bryobacteraceae bacterium]
MADTVDPRRILGLLVLLLLGCTASLCQKVKTEYDKSIDFSQFHRYSWRQHPEFERHPDLEEQFSVAIDLIKSDVNRGLTTKGFSRVEDSPDFYVTFFITVRGMEDVRVISTGGWYGWGAYWYPGWTEVITSQYAEGTLVLDFVDAATKRLAWRAYCKDEIREMKTRHENIEKTVRKALKKFPPKTNGATDR